MTDEKDVFAHQTNEFVAQWLENDLGKLDRPGFQNTHDMMKSAIRRLRAMPDEPEEIEWQYGVYDVYNDHIINNGDYKTMQTHRRRKAGEWERIPEDEVEGAR